MGFALMRRHRDRHEDPATVEAAPEVPQTPQGTEPVAPQTQEPEEKKPSKKKAE